MSAPAKRRVYLSLAVCLWFALSPCSPALAQEGMLGSIIGHVRVERGDTPPQRILVTLDYLGAPRDSTYTDGQGTYGFHNLSPGPYGVTVNDELYEPVRRHAAVEATSLGPTTFVDITLIPKSATKTGMLRSTKSVGANPNLMDVREYTAKFPKPARNEFEKGLKADQAGNKDNAIRHYQKALQIAPEFYYAHNNLGSDYLSKSDFAAARREFEQVIRLNQSDASAYFNLSNVCMLMSNLPAAQNYLEEGMRRQPESAFGHFLLGSLDIRWGKLAEAEGALRQAIHLDPAMAQPRLQLVILLLQESRKADAVAELHDFVSSFPDHSFSPQAKQLLQRLEGAPRTTPPN